MPETRLGRLAGRMKAEIDKEEQRRKSAEESKARADAERRETESRLAKRRAEAQKARKAMLAELLAFGKELGHVKASGDDEGVTLAFRGREVRFEEDGPEDRIALRIPGDVVPRNHHLTRDGDQWEVVFDHGTVVNRYPLEDGMEEILRNQLLVPLPDPSAAPAKAEEKSEKRKRGRGGKVTPGSDLQELKHQLD